MIPDRVWVIIIAGLVVRLVTPLPLKRHIAFKVDEAIGHVALWLRRWKIIKW